MRWKKITWSWYMAAIKTLDSLKDASRFILNKRLADVFTMTIRKFLMAMISTGCWGIYKKVEYPAQNTMIWYSHNSNSSIAVLLFGKSMCPLCCQLIMFSPFCWIQVSNARDSRIICHDKDINTFSQAIPCYLKIILHFNISYIVLAPLQQHGYSFPVFEP